MKRISILALILFVCFGSAAWGQQVVCKAHTPWTEFHMADMRRWNRCENVLNVNNVENLYKKWSHKTGSAVESSPAVVNGVVYVGSYDNKVYALNASTGALLWSYATGNSVDSSPAVANGVVYVGSWDFYIFALNAKTGALLWNFPGDITDSPAVANGMLYYGTYGGGIVAFGLKKGRE